MEVTLYRFEKKLNSTRQPRGGEDFSCEVFDPCSIISPTLIFGGDVTEYNYCHVPAWNRYYFLSNWEYRQGRWCGTFQVDALASYKEEIGGSSQYVTRSSARGDGSITDSVYVQTAIMSINTQTAGNPLSSGSGSFVVGIGGDQTTYYSMSESQLNTLTAYIFSDDYADSLIGQIFTDVYPELKTQVNPLQYISSIQWIPMDVRSSASVPIYVGWVRTPAVGSRLTTATVATDQVSFTLPRHPAGGGQGSYLNAAPYTRYSLFFPPFGCIQLPSGPCLASSSVVADIMCEPSTGEAFLNIKIGGAVVSRVSAKISTTIQLGQIIAPGIGAGSIIQGAAGTVADVAGAVGSALTGNVAGAVSGVAGAINNGVERMRGAAASQIPSINTVGTPNGGTAANFGDVQLIAEFGSVVSKDPTHKGTPLCQVASVGSLGGYMEISWPHIEIPGTAEETQTILQMMGGGFYYE